MKLFVWANPYKIDYGSSMFFAVAETVEQARKIAAWSPAFAFVQYGGARSADYSGVVLGEPVRVVDIGEGYGEWHEWSE